MRRLMLYYTYILVGDLRSNWSYVGMTSDLNRRISQHQNGNVRATKGYRPLRMLHAEEYSSRIEARYREMYLKSGVGRTEKDSLVHYSRIV